MNYLELKKKALLNSVSEDLPYIELDYIESTGTQWINTGIIPQWSATNNPTIKVRGGLSETSLKKASFLYGVQEGYSMAVFFYASSNIPVLRIQFCEDAFVNYYALDYGKNNLFEIEIDYAKKGASVNDQTKKVTFSRYKTWTKPIYLFANNNEGIASPRKAKIDTFQYKDNTQHIDLIPVIRKSDGEVCMYDRISKKFFTNQGTDKFIAGNIKDNILRRKLNETIQIY